MERLFVAIAAYEEPDLPATIADALAMAAVPDRLSFGVCEQARARGALTDLSAALALVHVDPLDSDGPAWARAVALDLRDDEDFLLQIDAHTRFRPGWDERLLAAWHAGAAALGHARVICSALPPAWRAGPYGRALLAERPPGAVRTSCDLAELDAVNGPLPVLAARPTEEPVGARGALVCNSFLFAPMALADALPADRALYMNTDDLALSARAWTHGWDVWHPADVPLHHHYRTGAPGEALLHWTHARAAERWRTPLARDAAARARLAALLAGADLGAYALGAARPLAGWLDAAGLKLAG